jgi:hypothetical protein
VPQAHGRGNANPLVESPSTLVIVPESDSNSELSSKIMYHKKCQENSSSRVRPQILAWLKTDEKMRMFIMLKKKEKI